MNEIKMIENLAEDLKTRHQCHTVILYGSYARGDFESASDIDLLGIKTSGEKLSDARRIGNQYLDAFIYSEADIFGKEEDFLRIRGGKIIFQKNKIAEDLLQSVEKIFLTGPKALTKDEQQLRKIWPYKMLARAQKKDIEGNFRANWLLFDLLENYFVLRGQWYLGPKQSFKYLKEKDPDIYYLFEKALENSKNLTLLKILVEKVVGS